MTKIYIYPFNEHVEDVLQQFFILVEQELNTAQSLELHKSYSLMSHTETEKRVVEREEFADDEAVITQDLMYDFMHHVLDKFDLIIESLFPVSFRNEEDYREKIEEHKEVCFSIAISNIEFNVFLYLAYENLQYDRERDELYIPLEDRDDVSFVSFYDEKITDFLISTELDKEYIFEFDRVDGDTTEFYEYVELYYTTKRKKNATTTIQVSCKTRDALKAINSQKTYDEIIRMIHDFYSYQMNRIVEMDDTTFILDLYTITDEVVHSRDCYISVRNAIKTHDRDKMNCFIVYVWFNASESEWEYIEEDYIDLVVDNILAVMRESYQVNTELVEIHKDEVCFDKNKVHLNFFVDKMT